MPYLDDLIPYIGSIDTLFFFMGLVGGIIMVLVMYVIYYEDAYDFDSKHRLDRNGGNT